MEIEVGGVLRRFRWGRVDELGTAAFSVDQTRRDPAWSQDQRLGTDLDLAEELGACLLGGFGMPADICMAAFGRLRDAGVFVDFHNADPIEIECLLAEPLEVCGRARPVRCFGNSRSYRTTHGTAPAIDLVSAQDDGVEGRVGAGHRN